MGTGKMNRKHRKELARELRAANPGLEVVHRKAAGIDVGNEAHYVAVRPDQETDPVRRFECFTADLHRLADWLKACGVETIAMQPLASIGFLCTTSWRNVASRYIW